MDIVISNIDPLARVVSCLRRPPRMRERTSKSASAFVALCAHQNTNNIPALPAQNSKSSDPALLALSVNKNRNAMIVIKKL